MPLFATGAGTAWDSVGYNGVLRGGKATLWEGGVRGIAFVGGPRLPAPARGTVLSLDVC